ncbi:MAG: hypothetical protein M5R36_28480 [Deltaproteobacteria bacterium]|nr:hypothetical protein [Deltaproteobacteria bacterium]
MIWIYGSVTQMLGFVLLPFAFMATLISARWRKGFYERLGWTRPEPRRDRVLVHLASVGEAATGERLVRALTERLGAERVVVSVVTPGGYDEAVRRFPGHRVAFFPADAGVTPWVWLRMLGIARVILFGDGNLADVSFDGARHGFAGRARQRAPLRSVLSALSGLRAISAASDGRLSSGRCADGTVPRPSDATRRRRASHPDHG